jgi:predicted DNA-binding transcriptional regulator YafY
MLETSARLLRLLSLLQARRDWTGPQLAERLGVTTRTVRNDVERLRSLGYPVDAAPGIAGGYRLGIGSALPPLLLDDDEAVAVAIGLRTAAGGTVSGIADSSVRALAKLERLLPPRLRHRIRALAAATVTLPGTGAVVDADVLTAIAAACRDHERLRFGYRRHVGTQDVRETEPHRLVHAGRRWYLLAWDVDRRDWRTFRVDRMALRAPTGRRFAPREMPEQEVTERLQRGLAQATWRYRARVTVLAPAARVSARLPAGIEVTAVDDATCVVEVGSDHPESLALYLGMLGADFRVDPAQAPDLAAHLRDLSARYARAVDPAG